MRKDAIARAFIEQKFLEKVKQKLNRMVKDMLRIPLRIGIFFMKKIIPVQENQIMFLTFRGEYDCNAKWIAEELRRRQKPYKIVWTIRPNVPVADIPKEFVKVYRCSYEFYKQLASSKIIVDNGISVIDVGYRKKKDQILIQTWHGSLGFKKFSKETNKDARWCRKADIEGKMTDYCLSNSTFEDEIFTDTFWSSARILQLGHARNDVLCVNDSRELRPIYEKVSRYFNFPKHIEALKKERHEQLQAWYQETTMRAIPDAKHLVGCNPFAGLDNLDAEGVRELLKSEYAKCEDIRICLYAPTFRDDGDMRPYEVDYEGLREALSTRFGGNWLILTRFHWRLRNKLKHYEYPAGVINASAYSDIQELLTCTDVGITDYSSWLCDYVLTRRPGFLFATDMEQYERNDRSFCYPLDTTPFPLAQNNEQLIQNILNFDNETYLKECEAFLKDKGCIDDGHASKRIADAIEKMFQGEKL